MNRKTVVAAVVIIAVAAFVLVYRQMGPPLPSTFQFSSVSPDKKYRADVYAVAPLTAMPGQGGAGSRSATVILRNDWGWKIGSSDDCEMLLDSVEIDWSYTSGAVSIAKARTIDFETGKCSE